jgi:hypothetical protein
VTVLDAAFWVVCLVLVAAGATKSTEPAPLATALRRLGVPGTAQGPRALLMARLIGLVEVVLGIAGLAVGGTAVAAAVAVAYGAFTVVVVLAIVRRLPSCGCFGSRSGPPSVWHAVLNGASAALAVLATAASPVPVADALDASGAGGWWALAAVLVAAGLVVVVDTRAGGATVARQHDRGDT